MVKINPMLLSFAHILLISFDFSKIFLEHLVTPSLWKHKHLPISFTLVVDDLGIKYVKKETAEHLLATLRKQYEILTDWDGHDCLGLTLEWFCNSMPKHATLSMLKHIPEGLHKLQHPAPMKPQHLPAKCTIPTCGAKIQCTDNTDEMQPTLPGHEIKYIQKAVGAISYYVSAQDNTVLIVLNDLSAARTKAKQSMKDSLEQLLDYLATHPNAKIRHCKSPMIL